MLSTSLTPQCPLSRPLSLLSLSHFPSPARPPALPLLPPLLVPRVLFSPWHFLGASHFLLDALSLPGSLAHYGGGRTYDMVCRTGEHVAGDVIRMWLEKVIRRDALVMW